MENPACNMEVLIEVTKEGIIFEDCDQPARWKHPRWPGGIYCDDCKEKLEDFFPDNWQRIEEDENGK